MSGLKPLVDAECGRPNALVQLSNRVGADRNAAARLLPSTSTRSLADSLTHDYLNDVSARSAAPSSFTMQQLLRNMPPGHQRAMVPRHQQAQGLSRHWSSEFLSSRPPEAAVAGEWTQEFMQSGSVRNAVMDGAWNQAVQPDTHLTALSGPQQRSSDKLLWSSEYLSNFDGRVANADATANQWAEEFVSSRQDSGSSYDYFDQLQNEWDQMSMNSPEHAWLNEYQQANLYRNYEMQDENPYLEVSDPLSEGKRLWSQGDLANAVLHFEAAVQKQPENPEAWLYLGSTQAENEQEASAIAALRKCLDLDPGNLDALFALAVAYTNESMDNDALSALERWLATNPSYAGLMDQSSVNYRRPRTGVTSFLDRQYFSELEQKFLEAAARQPNGSVDPQLQNALGVLYNLSGNFERAVDSLQAALTVQPEDARLWNRLGATMANSDRPAEAVSSYHRALQLYPGYVRARYNLGISCMNLRSHGEAIEHFISALELQQRGLGPQKTTQLVSDGIWQTVRSAVMRMDNSDELLKVADTRNISEFANTFHRLRAHGQTDFSNNLSSQQLPSGNTA